MLLLGDCSSFLSLPQQITRNIRWKQWESILLQCWGPEVWSKCQQGHAPSNVLERNPSWPLPASGSSRCSLASGCITPISISSEKDPQTFSSVCVLKGHLPLYLKPTWIIQDVLILVSLTQAHLQRLFFQIIYIHSFHGLGFEHTFWPTSQPTIGTLMSFNCCHIVC